MKEFQFHLTFLGNSHEALVLLMKVLNKDIPAIVVPFAYNSLTYCDFTNQKS